MLLTNNKLGTLAIVTQKNRIYFFNPVAFLKIIINMQAKWNLK